ncbi:hypothetical protein ACJZ2D_014935 [Fusarium nematophilum]
MRLEPSQVRLHPTRNDPYKWHIFPGKEYLFEKNLSDNSVRVYQELHDGVGVFFEATEATEASLDARGNTGSLDSTAVSFASRINELQVQKDYAAQEMNLLKSQLETEVKLRLDLEERLQAAYEREGCLKEDLQKTASRENYYRDAALGYSQGIAKVLPALRDLSEKTYFTDAGFI